MLSSSKRRTDLNEHFQSQTVRLKEQRERREQQSQSEKNPEESVTAFWLEMHCVKDQVATAIELAEVGEEEKNRERILGEMVESCQNLQKRVAAASLFLPAYDLRLAQDMTNKLFEEINFCRTRLLPRQKFTFKNRKSVPKPVSELLNHNNNNNNHPNTSSTSTSASAKQQQFEDDPIRNIHNLNGQVIVRTEAEIGSSDVSISNMTDCTIFLCGSATAIRMDKLTRVRIFAAPLKGGSVLIDHCVDCVFALASQQIRVHHATSCDFYLVVRSHPIIEHSTRCRFGPYIYRPEGLEGMLKEASLSLEDEFWKHVEDFNWLRVQQSPNWSLIPEEERMQITQTPKNI